VKDWKGCERRVDEFLGGRRVPVSGRKRDDTPDVVHERLSTEVKSRRRLPSWLEEEAMKQAEPFAKDEQLPVTVLHLDSRMGRGAGKKSDGGCPSTPPYPFLTQGRSLLWLAR
jgi:hypothetical protein